MTASYVDSHHILMCDVRGGRKVRRYFLDHLRRGDVLPDHLPTSSSNASTMAASFCMDKPRSTLDPTAYLQVRSYRS